MSPRLPPPEVLHLRPQLRPPSEVTRVLQIEVKPGITAAEVTGQGAHLLTRSGGEHDGFNARDVGG